MAMRPVGSAGVGWSAAGAARPFGKRAAAALLLGLLLLWTLPGSARGGQAPRRGQLDPQVRAAMVARLKARAVADKAQAVTFAKARGIPVRGSTGHQTYELMKVRNGRPFYYITRNVDAAMSTGADQARSTYTVDGGGLTVGVWDGGWIYHRHQEFGGRVTLQDFDLPGTGDGLWGEYYGNMTLSGAPAQSQVDPTIDFDWGTKTKVYKPGPTDNYSISWSGHVLAAHSETYTFYVLTGDDDGVRLLVDGQVIYDDWDAPVAGEHSATIDLSIDERYNITLEYYENTGPAMVQLSWSSDASTPKQIIPQDNLFSSWATGWHATHVGGTIAAFGDETAAEGMAPAVSIDSYEWNSDYAEMTAAGASAPGEADKIYVSNHSYGYLAGWNIEFITSRWEWRWVWYGPWPAAPETAQEPFFGQYETETASVDQVAYNLPYYLIFCSAGNERSDNPEEGEGIRYTDPPFYYFTYYDPANHPAGDGVYKSGYDTLSPWSGAKNVMSVGAVTDAVFGGARDAWSGRMRSFSSWGPTDDGRIKPDIVANGHDVYSCDDVAPDAYYTSDGTSMSSPNAAGSAILLQDHAGSSSCGVLRASTLKG
ncbi:MAG: S8 family serine peptidase, partial [Planctomycetota bacterium]